MKWVVILMIGGCSPIYYAGKPAPPPASTNPSVPSGLTQPPKLASKEGLIAYLHSWPYQRSPRVVELINYSHYYLQVRLDGQKVIFQDNTEVIPHLPPGKQAYTFTYRFGNVEVEADGFLPPIWEKVAHYSGDEYFSPNYEYQDIEFHTHWFKSVQ